MTRSLFNTACLVACALCVPGAWAEPVTVLGRTIDLVKPPGFCELGDSPREKTLLETRTTMLAPVGIPAQFTVPCDELEPFRTGRLERFTRWVTVLVVTERGQLAPVVGSRKEFVQATAANLGWQQPRAAKADGQPGGQITRSGVTVKIPGIEPIGIDNDTFFASGQTSAEINGKVIPGVAVVGLTVANHARVRVQVQGFAPATAQELLQVARAYTREIVARNPE